MASGTLGWNTSPNTIPTTSAAMPIIWVRSPPVRSRAANLFGEVHIPHRAGGQRELVGGADGDADAVGGLQQPQPLQAGAAIEDVRHRVRRPHRIDDIRTGDRAV